MRIVGGAYRGRALAAPPGTGTRPTSDRARQAIFNVLEHARWSPGLAGLRVIDLFAGSGAMGLEAISRGAAFCLFVETDATARGVIRENIQTLAPDSALFGATRVHRRDATDLGQRPGADGPAFDLAFLDPPYGRGLAEVALARLAEGGWLAEGAVLSIERGSEEAAALPPGYETLDERRYGAASVLFARWGSAGGA
jgi:16S rRNA (guanine966-N2)-methyltransferase